MYYCLQPNKYYVYLVTFVPIDDNVMFMHACKMKTLHSLLRGYLTKHDNNILSQVIFTLLNIQLAIQN